MEEIMEEKSNGCSTALSGMLAALIPVAMLAAQGSVSIQVVSASIRASAGSQSRQANSVGRVDVSDRDPVWNCSASAFALAAVTGTSASVATSATSTGLCGPPPFASGMSAGGSARLVVRLTASSATPVAGVLTLQGVGFPFATIDVGDDGRSEPINSAIPIVVDANGVTVRLTCSAHAVAPVVPFAGTSAQFTFTAGPNGLDTALAPCEAGLSGWMTRFSNGDVRIDLSARTTVAMPAGFFVFALTTQNLVVPPLGCVLGVDLLIPVVQPVDGNGHAEFSVRLPGPLPSAVLYQQFLAGIVDPRLGTIWRTSNRLAFQLP